MICFKTSENTPRFTNRAIRKVVKLFNIEDGHWREDMEQVLKLLKELKIEASLESSTPTSGNLSCECCCQSHCALSEHVRKAAPLVNEEYFEESATEINLEVKQKGWDYNSDDEEDYLQDETSMMNPNSVMMSGDSFMKLITSLGMNPSY